MGILLCGALSSTAQFFALMQVEGCRSLYIVYAKRYTNVHGYILMRKF